VKMAELHNSSFRDPSGFIYSRDGVVYRQINKSYSENFEYFQESGLLAELQGKGLLIQHKDADINTCFSGDAYRVIKPQIVPYITYPFEWSFSQLKDAALLTLDIVSEALDAGMILKDATAYNVQFLHCKPIFIDTLSFKKYTDGEAWVAYGQFCRHFLAPLALMRYVDISMNQLLRTNIDGIPLDLCCRLLPKRTKLSMGLLIHLFFHASTIQNNSAISSSKGKGLEKKKSISNNGLLGIIDSLKSTIRNLNWQPQRTEWAQYYQNTNYSNNAFENKINAVDKLTKEVQPLSVLDLGANNGTFSRIAARYAKTVVSFDCDPAAVEKNYLECRKSGEEAILPLLIDLTNPTSSFGWSCAERDTIFDRIKCDMIFALALIHHLAITNNLPFDKIARFFDNVCTSLLIEFVPKSDSQVIGMLRSRDDIFDTYTIDDFEQTFCKYFKIIHKVPIDNSDRVLYLMRKNYSL